MHVCPDCCMHPQAQSEIPGTYFKKCKSPRIERPSSHLWCWHRSQRRRSSRHDEVSEPRRRSARSSRYATLARHDNQVPQEVSSSHPELPVSWLGPSPKHARTVMDQMPACSSLLLMNAPLPEPQHSGL